MTISSVIEVKEQALIYIGAASISMIIGCDQEDERFEIIEHLDRPLPLASHIFRMGEITREVVDQTISIIQNYLSTVSEYHLPLSRVRLLTNNLLVEASNYEVFLNRLQVATGIMPQLIDDGNMTRHIYLIAMRLIQTNPELKKGKTFVSHIGPGNTRALYFNAGKLIAYSNYRLGIFRAQEAVHAEEHVLGYSTYLEEHIRGVVDHLAQDYAHYRIDNHLAIGLEIQSLAPQLAKPQNGTCVVKEQELEKLSRTLAKLNPDELVRQLHMHYTGGEAIVPALLANLALARRFGDDRLWVPDGDFNQQLILDLMHEVQLQSSFEDEVVEAAHDLVNKFKCDRKHVVQVAKYSTSLFEALVDLHQLPRRYELLLRVAALLHEVGMFVSPREHHKHSLYLLMNTEIFGLSSHDRLMVALLARYHRRYNPEITHPYFADLTRDERMILYKLSAILRLADALDRSHSQRLNQMQFVQEKGRFVIQVKGVEDVTLEQIAIHSKCDLFRDIYGLEILLMI
jgi:exopolyphosphatase/guanosine-5'-triphosphate,3'-diphosphate pyrophosphatase